MYVDQNYRLTHDESQSPKHYGWKQPARIDTLIKTYHAVKNGRQPLAVKVRSDRDADVRGIIQAVDAEGRWISTYVGERLVGQPNFRPGFHYLSSAVFVQNIQSISEYIDSSK